MADLNDRLRALGRFDVGERTPTGRLRQRAQARKRRQFAGAGLAGAVIMGMAIVGFAGADDRRDDVATTGRDDDPSAHEREATGATVPSLLGQTVAEASAAAAEAGLSAVVQDGSGDSDLPGALVIAQEPPGGASVPDGSVIGLRTALPDTDQGQECPGTSHPHSRPVAADALPLVEQIERSAVDAAWLDAGSELDGVPLVLGIWDRYAYEMDEGAESSIVAAEGFQLMALYGSAEDCPAAVPLFIGGAPVTRVILDRTDFARDDLALTTAL